jgi:hypothetical protein
MKPNEHGGVTLENRYETNAVASALAVNGHSNDSLRLAVDGRWESVCGNIDPDILGEPEKVLILNPEDSKIVIESLRKVAKGQVLVQRKIDELIAQSMIAGLDGEDFVPRANRVRKALTHLKYFLG